MTQGPGPVATTGSRALPALVSRGQAPPLAFAEPLNGIHGPCQQGEWLFILLQATLLQATAPAADSLFPPVPQATDRKLGFQGYQGRPSWLEDSGKIPW